MGFKQISCNVYANDTYEDDLAKSYCDYLFYNNEFSQNVQFVSGLNINDEYRIPNTKIEIIAWCEMPKPYREVEV